MTTLQESMLAPDRQPAVVADCLTLIHEEVSDLSGISGAAIKVAYKSVTTFAGNHVRYTVESKLPGMVAKLEPYWSDFSKGTGDTDFGLYLTAHSSLVTGDLLSVTDASAAGPTARPAVVKAYGAVRGQAAKHVAAALPRVGALVQKYASLCLSAFTGRAFAGNGDP